MKRRSNCSTSKEGSSTQEPSLLNTIIEVQQQHQQPTEDDDEYMYFVYPQSIQNEQLTTFHYADYYSDSSSAAASEAGLERSQIETHYTQALCLCLGKGGTYTQQTVGWLKGFLQHKQIPPVLVEAVEALLEQASELTLAEFQDDCQLLQVTLERAKRSIVFDLFQGAAVTGFRSSVMNENILKMASTLGVSDFETEDIRYAVVLDEQYRRHQIAKLYPTLPTRKDSNAIMDHMLMLPRIEHYSCHGWGTGRSDYPYSPRRNLILEELSSEGSSGGRKVHC